MTTPSTTTALAGSYEALCAQAEQLLARRQDPRPWMEGNLLLRTKTRTSAPFRFNAVQADYYARRSPRDVILKSRQVGFTTLNCGLLFADTLLVPNTTSVIVARDAESAARIFTIVQRFWQCLPESEQRVVGPPQYANRAELSWPTLDSRIYVLGAGALSAGRGLTINNLLCSEFAFWTDPEETLVALSEAVPQEGRIVIESTPNGLGNFFHSLWQDAQEGENGYQSFFYPWWRDPGNRREGAPLGPLSEEEARLQAAVGLEEAQLRWRRAKSQQLGARFAQEHPEDPLSCFLLSGRPYFELSCAHALAAHWVRSPLSVEENGRLSIWEEPAFGRTYVMGADVAEGKQYQQPADEERGGSDFSCAVVRDWQTGEQVAEWHGRVPEATFAERLALLQRRYPGKLICERNNSGVAVLARLEQLCPSALWRDPRDGRPGWRTTAESRPVLLSGLAEAIQNRALGMRSEGFYREVRAFQVTDTGRAEAARGDHDDRIIATALSEYLRHRESAPRADGRPFPAQTRRLVSSIDTGIGGRLERPVIYDRETRSDDGPVRPSPGGPSRPRGGS